MFAHLLLDSAIPTLKTNDTIGHAIQVMQDSFVRAIPVINDKDDYLGMIIEDNILDIDDYQKPVAQHISEIKAIPLDEHFLNIVKYNQLSQHMIAPVIQSDQKYLGSISESSIIQFLSKDRSIEEQGGIIILEIKSINYSMVEIAKIVESNNASIIYSFISNSNHADNILVSLKINKPDLKEIMLSFERFNYKTIAVFHVSGFEEGLKERYDSLMVYLNI